MQKPYIQGALDGLCGIYAVVNAFKRLAWLSEEQCEMLFKELVIEISHKFPKAIWFGTTRLDVEKMIASAILWCEKNTSAEIECLIPFARNELKSIRVWKRELSEYLEMPGTTAIVGFEHPCYHWSVVDMTARNSLRFFDSQNLKRLNKSKLTLQAIPQNNMWQVDAASTFIIQKNRQ